MPSTSNKVPNKVLDASPMPSTSNKVPNKVLDASPTPSTSNKVPNKVLDAQPTPTPSTSNKVTDSLKKKTKSTLDKVKIGIKKNALNTKGIIQDLGSQIKEDTSDILDGSRENIKRGIAKGIESGIEIGIKKGVHASIDLVTKGAESGIRLAEKGILTIASELPKAIKRAQEFGIELKEYTSQLVVDSINKIKGEENLINWFVLTTRFPYTDVDNKILLVDGKGNRVILDPNWNVLVRSVDPSINYNEIKTSTIGKVFFTIDKYGIPNNIDENKLPIFFDGNGNQILIDSSNLSIHKTIGLTSIGKKLIQSSNNNLETNFVGGKKKIVSKLSRQSSNDIKYIDIDEYEKEYLKLKYFYR
jgi:hypothetical protein